MKFRPCIDLHDGVVKQIVGGSLKDVPAGQTETPLTNFVATKPAAEFARFVVLVCSSLHFMNAGVHAE